MIPRARPPGGSTMAKTNRPVIGINTDFIAPGKQTRAHARLNAGYFDAILTAGGLPLILPPVGSRAEIDATLDRIDGIVLSSGLDLDPKRNGLPPHPAVLPMAERRDDHD